MGTVISRRERAQLWFSSLPSNLLAGLTVAVVALPLALAFGIGAGLGAQAGITTAVIAGALAAAFGGSKYQVSGPTGAMTVVLIPIVATYGPTAVLQVGLMAAGFLFLASALRLGKHIHRLPSSLIEGFTAGIAIVIALQQVACVLGVAIERKSHVWEAAYEEVVNWFQNPQFVAIGVGLLVLALNLLSTRFTPKIPMALLSVALATVFSELLQLDIERIGELPSQFASFSLDFMEEGNWLILIPPALAVGFLAGLEGLLSAKIADNLAGDKSHQANRELFGQGIANLAVPFFGGVPATAALARTALNVKSGANSRIAAFSHAIILLGFVFLVGQWIELIPLAALGGLLMSTAVHMVRVDELKKTSGKSKLDALVLLITLIVTVVFDLISALLVGLLLFALLRKTRLAKAQPKISEEQTLGD